MRSAIRVLCTFAILWTASAMFCDPAIVRWCFAVFVLAAALIVQTFGGSIPERTGEARGNAWRIVAQWSIVEGVGIVAAVFALGALHQPDYVMPAIIAIMGLHFIPLAIQLPLRAYYATAFGCLIIAGYAARVPDPAHLARAALATAFLLVLTAVTLTALSRNSRVA